MKESKQENLGGDGSRQTLLCSSIGNTIYLDASKVILLNQENRSISKQVNPEVPPAVIQAQFVYRPENCKLVDTAQSYFTVLTTNALQSLDNKGFKSMKIKRESEDLAVNDAENVAYVNHKQYKRIIIRRAKRQKLVESGKIPPTRCKYLYESRHKHATKRQRGVGGRFIGNFPKSFSLRPDSHVADAALIQNENFKDLVAKLFGDQTKSV